MSLSDQIAEARKANRNPPCEHCGAEGQVRVACEKCGAGVCRAKCATVKQKQKGVATEFTYRCPRCKEQ